MFDLDDLKEDFLVIFFGDFNLKNKDLSEKSPIVECFEKCLIFVFGVFFMEMKEFW